MIDYGLLGLACTEFKQLGYEYAEMPWLASESAIKTTLPSGRQPIKCSIEGLDRSTLVGSAEQSFIDAYLYRGMYPSKKIPGMFAITPCFRNEPVFDELHKPYFMKLELFTTNDCWFHIFMVDVLNVYKKLTNRDIFEIEETKEGFDIVGKKTRIEVGSYGSRSLIGQSWAYGTGIALPRFSQVWEKELSYL